MKKQYAMHRGRWLMGLWGLSIMLGKPLNVWAQTTQPPVIQWQQVVDGADVSPVTGVRAVQTTKREYVVLAGKNLVRLSATGNVIWNKVVPGSYQDSLANYVPVLKTVALAPTQDDGTVVLAQDVLNIYSVTKLDAAGTVVWTKIVDRANTGPNIRVTDNALVAAPDGSFLVVGSYTDRLSYLTLTKLNREGAIAGQWRINYTGQLPGAAPTVRRVLATADGGYLLVGKAANSAASQGLAVKLDSKYAVTWKNTYSALDSLSDVVAKPQTDNTYLAIGPGAGGNGKVITIVPNGAGDSTQTAALSGSNTSLSLSTDAAGNLTVLDGTSTNSRDFRLLSLSAQSVVNWTKSLGGSGTDTPTTLVTTSDGGYLLVGTTTSTNGDITGKSTNAAATWVVKLGNSPVATTLNVQVAAYNCQTGVIVFSTTGGNGSPITYTTPGVTRANATDNFGTIEAGLRNDPKVITIQAMQSGQTVSSTFDIGAYCRNGQPTSNSANSTALMMTPPTYNCQTGAIMFHTTGGDGSPVEYAAPGITGWTTNPSQFVDAETRTANDAAPLTLMARQNGQVVMYVLDVKAVCGRARLAATESAPGPTVSVLGNPVREAVTINVSGAEGQPLLMRLIDGRGRLVEDRAIKQAGLNEQQTFDVRQQAPGVLMLHTTINGHIQTIKILKQ